MADPVALVHAGSLVAAARQRLLLARSGKRPTLRKAEDVDAADELLAEVERLIRLAS
jgi:hypothetical protein